MFIDRFRVWNKEKKKMQEFSLYELEGYDGECTCVTLDGQALWYTGFSDEPQLSEEFIMMQSTGLKDKNGKEIFCGDILDKTIYRDLRVTEGAGKVEMGIGYDSDGHSHEKWLGWKAGESSLLDIHKYSQIIGNIYQHPHLLDE